MSGFGFGIGVAAGLLRPRAPEGPVTLFTGGLKGAWYDPSDLTSMRQDSAGSIAAAENAPVGLLLDKSGNGLHLVQSSAARRPMLRSDGTRHFLEFDGVDDVFVRSGSLVASDGSVTCVAAVRLTAAGNFPYVTGNTADHGFNMLYSSNTRQPRTYVTTTGGVVAGISGIAVPDGADHSLRQVLDRPGLRVRLFENGVERLSLPGIDSDLTEGAETYLGGHIGSGVYFPGRIYGFFIVSRLLSQAETGRLESFIAARAGIAT
jgi:hypothetical protein